MHVKVCDFTVSLPTYDKIKPVPGRKLSVAYTRELINAIVNSVDRFYKPRIACRRRFNIYIPFVFKYYPNYTSIAKKQSSFLHKNCDSDVALKRPKYKKAFSLVEISAKQSVQNYYNSLKICHDFLVNERFMSDVQKSSVLVCLNKDKFSKYAYGLNFAQNEVNRRPKRTGVGLKKSFRKSFPLMSSTANSVS